LPAGGIVTPIMNQPVCAYFGTMTTTTTLDSPLGVGVSAAE